MDGAKELGFIATSLLQTVCHAADTERTFSQMGHVHTAVRNRLEPDTVRDLVIVKQWHSQR